MHKMNLFDLLLRKNAEQNKTIDFKPLVKDPLADSTGYRADGSMAQAQELPLVQINNDNTATTQQWQEHKKPTFGQRVGEMLFGKQAQATDSVNTENPLFNMITAKTDDWKKQGISDEAIQGVAQGLNSGNKELAQFITDNKINTPKTSEEIALAKEGKFNSYAPIQTTISENPRVGGALPNFINGYRENTNNGFNLENWTNNIGLDGNKKGLAYRVGEGLGTAARFLDSPAGKMLLAYGASNMLGDTNPLEQAFTAGAVNLNARMNDKLYRNALEDEGVDTSNLKGFITKDTYNSLNQGSARYMNAVTRQQATESMKKLRALQVEKQKIINSTLPDLEKAKLIKANAEAQHAEEYTLAKINALNNSGYLGMLNYGLNALRTNVAVAKEARQAAKEEEEKRILEGLLGGGNNTGIVRIKAPNGYIYHVPESKVDEAIKNGGVRI